MVDLQADAERRAERAERALRELVEAVNFTFAWVDADAYQKITAALAAAREVLGDAVS